MQFKHNRDTLSINGKLIGDVSRSGKLVAWRVKQKEQVQVAQAVVNDGMLWHAPLGHVSASKMNVLAKACDGFTKLIMEMITKLWFVEDVRKGR